MPAHPAFRATLLAGFAGALAWVGACKGPLKVMQPIECPDPCCGGNGEVDCEANPNVNCTEDADICTARNYGCSNGSEYQGVIPSNRPISCLDGGGLGDVVSFSLPDGFGLLPPPPSGDAAPSSTADAGGDDASDATGDDETVP
jgi:hypothetical protein